MTSLDAFGKNFLVAELKAVCEPCRTCPGALSVWKDGLIDLDLDLAWDIDRGGESSSSEISMIS